MAHIRLCVFAFIIVFIFPTAGSAEIFEDNFDDVSFTSSNWIQAIPQWDFYLVDDMVIPPDLGFRGTYVNNDPVAIADNASYYKPTNLFISTEVLILEKEIYEPGSTTPKDQGGGIGIINFSTPGIAASLFNSGGEWLHAAGITGEGGPTELPISNVDFGSVYTLELSINEAGTVSSRVLNASGQVLSTINNAPSSDIPFGIVVIGSDSDVVHNNFMLGGQPHIVGPCHINFDHDMDLDGVDLAIYIASPIPVLLEDVAANFGRMDCPLFDIIRTIEVK